MSQNLNTATNNPQNATPSTGAGAATPGVNQGGEARAGEQPESMRWYLLTVFQYLLIAAVTITFVFVLAKGVSFFKGDSGDIGNMEDARGLITFVVAVGTIAIAMMLAISAIVTRDPQRLTVGKEILTILVGVLGTIVGFYYGAATKTEAGANSGANNRAAQTSSAPVTISPPQLTSGPPATFSTKLSGGTAPYSYSIRFTPDTIPAIENQVSANGEINHQFTVPVPAGTEVTFFIEGTDKNKVAFEINKDGKQKIPVR